MLGRRKRNRYKFTEKKQSKRGIAALVVAILIEIVYISFFECGIQRRWQSVYVLWQCRYIDAWHISGRFRVCHQKPL